MIAEAPTFLPRDYQSTALQSVIDAFKEHQKVLVQMPTGTGKTVLFAMLLKSRAHLGRGLVLAHRAELIEQAVKTIEDVAGLRCEIEMGAMRADDGFTLGGRSDVVVSSVQTQIAPKRGTGRALRRMHKFDPCEFATVIVDEAHHSIAQSWRTTIEYYATLNPDIRVLGVTATPKRGDEKALGIIYDHCAYEMPIKSAVDDGWLVPIEQLAVYIEELDFSKTRTTAGDLNQGDLGRVCDREAPMHKVVLAVLEYAGDLKTLIFSPSVECAKRTSEILNRPDHKPDSARYIHGKMGSDERRHIIRGFRRGEFQYLVNCMIATEGFDVPDIGCVLPSPTKVLAKYMQQLGRGTRPLSGVVDGPETPQERREAIARSAKQNLLVLDVYGVSGQHKLIHVEDVLGGDYTDEIRMLAAREAMKSGQARNIEERLAEAAEMAEENRRERERRELADAESRQHVRASAKVSSRVVDPFAAIGFEPARNGYDMTKRPTSKMVARLRYFKVPEELIADMSFGEAGEKIGALNQRRKDGLCSWKQANILRRNRINPSKVRFQEASVMIDGISQKQGWGKR